MWKNAFNFNPMEFAFDHSQVDLKTKIHYDWNRNNERKKSTPKNNRKKTEEKINLTWGIITNKPRKSCRLRQRANIKFCGDHIHCLILQRDTIRAFQDSQRPQIQRRPHVVCWITSITIQHWEMSIILTTKRAITIKPNTIIIIIIIIISNTKM